MPDPKDINTFFENSENLALRLPAEQVFSMWRRSIRLPEDVIALSRSRSGASQLHKAGQHLEAGEVDSVLFARTEPADVVVEIDSLPAADGYLADAQVYLRLAIVPERRELESFENNILGSRDVAATALLVQHLRADVDSALRLHTAGKNIEELMGASREQAATAIADALQGPCFAAGLQLAAAPSISFQSEAFGRVLQAREHAAQRRDEQAAHAQIESAIAAAQRDRVAHLEEMLTRLRSLADSSPQLDLPALMHTFDETQRGELYRALFASSASGGATRWIAVAAGGEVLYYAPNNGDRPVRKVSPAGEIGPLRAVQFVSDSGGDANGATSAGTLLIGAARGVYELPVDGNAVTRQYRFAEEHEVRGGVNAADRWNGLVAASHSEIGIVVWPADAPDEPRLLHRDRFAGASAVRAVQFAAGRLWFTVDDAVASVPISDLDAEPTIWRGSLSTLTALRVTDGGVYAGNRDGQILLWTLDGDGPRLLHAGSRRAAESIALQTRGGVHRLVFTDTSLAVHARVLGDRFAARYEAGGQTLRRAEIASDCIVATTDNRDRLIVWRTDKPELPSAVIPVTQQTGRSVQDVALVPEPATVA